ncbi:hypothetical protein EYF80_033320 [Liparis tanakae]|uniref:Uncharacterized protein n=1 Tax=Liparis tanakae TaxID=230148 RepID=A0A4Z2GT77_9TELE|nr:hypothetical protein EYF80_033320 [Liparis tanakae]
MSRTSVQPTGKEPGSPSGIQPSSLWAPRDSFPLPGAVGAAIAIKTRLGSVIRGGSVIYPFPANSIRSDLSRNPVPRRRLRWRPPFITRRDPGVRPPDNAVNNHTTHGNILIAVIIRGEAGAIDHGDGSWRGGGALKGAVPLRVEESLSKTFLIPVHRSTGRANRKAL